jgi:hypothetical protein
MAFVVKKDLTVTCICTISEPADGGGFNDYKVPLKFKILSQARIDDIIRNDAEDDVNIMDEVLVGWDDGVFKDEAGVSLPFNDENKRLVLSIPYIRNSMMKAFFTTVAGKQAKRKN